MPFIALVVFLGILPILLALLWTFDRLVGIEFTTFPENWRADGRPCTLLWPREDMPTTIRTKLAATKCSFVWVFVSPPWSRGHPEASRCARRLRVLFWLWNLVAMPLFALAAFLSAVLAG